jgi:hypothetical protein
VGDQDDRGAHLVVHVVQPVEDEVPRLVVELAGRLVGEQQARQGRDGDRERGELESPGRERVQRRSGHVGEAHQVEDLSRGGDRASDRASGPLGERDVLAGVEVGQQVASGALEDQPDFGGAVLVEGRLGHPPEVVTADPDPAGARPHQPAEQGEQGRLAGPGRAEQADHLAGPHVEVDPRRERRRRALDR